MNRAAATATRAIWLAAAIGAPAVAGSVLKVDPTDPAAFSQISAAVAAASPGDIVVVHPKPVIPGIPSSDLYAPFTVDKSLTIVAEAGALVRTKTARIRDLGPDDHVVIRDLVFERALPIAGPEGASNVVLENNRGAIWLEGCTFRISEEGLFALVGVPPTPVRPAVDVIGPLNGAPGFAVFVRCTVEGNPGATQLIPTLPCYGCQMAAGDGIRVERFDVAVWDSTVTGGKGQPGGIATGLPGGPGGNAIVLSDALLFASGSTFAGGDGGGGAFAPGSGCVGGGDGGNGALLSGSATAEMLATTRTGGAPGAGAGACGAGQPGSPDVGPPGSVVDLVGPSYSLFAESPKREGENLHLELDGPLFGRYLVDLDFAPIFVHATPTGAQGVRHIVGLGASTGSLPLYPQFLGQFLNNDVIELPLSGLLGGQQGRTVYFQAACIDVYPGGQQAYSSPSAMVLLDAGL